MQIRASGRNVSRFQTVRKSLRTVRYRHVKIRRHGRTLRRAISACGQSKPLRLNAVEDVATLVKLAAELSSRTSKSSVSKEKDSDRVEIEKSNFDEVKIADKVLELLRVYLWLWSLVGTKLSISPLAITLKRFNHYQTKKSQTNLSGKLFVSKGIPPSKKTPIMMPPDPINGVNDTDQSMELKDSLGKDKVCNTELSWLAFNWRVLALTEDEETPLIERLKFLAITTSNLDEFFSKRVGELIQQRETGLHNSVELSNKLSPSYQLELISKEVSKMVEKQSNVFHETLIPEMKTKGIRILRYSEMNQNGVQELARIFKTNIEALLTPIRLDPAHPFPYLASQKINLAVLLEDPNNSEQKTECAIISIPDSMDRWRQLPTDFALAEDSWITGFMRVEEIVINHITELFGGMKIIGIHPFRITRNADQVRNEEGEETEDLITKITRELRDFRCTPFVRLEVNEGSPDDLVDLLSAELALDFDQDVHRIPYLIEQRDLFGLVSSLANSVKSEELNFRASLPQRNHRLAQKTLRWTDLSRSGKSWKDRRSIFSIIRSGDVLIHHPYQSFDSSILRFLEESATDSNVLAIKTTLTRCSENSSPVIDILHRAKKRGKTVTVFVENRTGLNVEESEMDEKLEQVGCRIVHGLVGVEMHCNTTLIVRKEHLSPNGLRSYVHTGTGNYNLSTVKFHTDFGLLTCDPELCQDVVDLFKQLTGLHNQDSIGGFKKLLLSNGLNHRQFFDLIDQEIEFAKQGKPAAICLKMNKLDDEIMIQKLYEAGEAGVRIDCIIRGICRLQPGMTGISENIRVISIVGRYLEHDRVACFHNNGDPLYFLGSNDWLPQNKCNGVSIVAPIHDENLKVKIRDYLSICLLDKKEAWELLTNQRYGKPASRTDEAVLSAPLIGHPEPTKLKRIAMELGTQNALIKLYELEGRTSVSWNSENADIE